MKKITTVLFSICLCTMLSAQNFEWAQRIGGLQDEQSYSIISDGHGYIYNTGYFAGTVDFDPGTGITNFTAGDNDIFVTKTDSLGNLIWARQLGGTSNDQGYAITVDASGNIYTTGFFEGTADFDPGSGIFSLTATGFNDIFVSKLDALGNFVWAKQMGGSTWDRGESIVVDANGNVYTTGYFTNTADFNPGSNVYNLTAAAEDILFQNWMPQEILYGQDR